jgi:hypothetical protein
MTANKKQIKQIENIIKSHFNIGDYIIRRSGSVEITKGGLHIKRDSPYFSKLPVRFLSCVGSFNISESDISSLDGCPAEVNGNFYCNGNGKIKTLAGGPKIVTGVYDCSKTSITNFENGPDKVGTLYCHDAGLTNLKNAPTVSDSFICTRCNITSLEGVQDKIFNRFNVSDNRLENFIGGPSKVMDYIANYNPLTSIEGAPIEVTNIFDITSNDRYLISLNFPKEFHYGTIIVKYQKNLHVLPLLRLPKFIIDNRTVEKIIKDCQLIKPFKQAVLTCQKMLIDAGFVGNASW